MGMLAGKRPQITTPQTFAESHRTIANLPNNIRFYILLCSLCWSLAVPAGARILFESDRLFVIRVEQIFGFMSIGFLYVALLISPLSLLLKRYPVSGYLQFSRRAIGVSACYFALLHAAVATWGQLGGLSGLLIAPTFFKTAFVLGAALLVCLLLMAATSFDSAIKAMTLRRWKWLHRLVYAGGILVILHVWMIGTHVSYVRVQQLLFGLLVVFFALEAYRIAFGLRKKVSLLKPLPRAWAFGILLFAFCTAVLWYMPRIVPNFHNKHSTGPNGVHIHPESIEDIR
jgi:methionine sulfoxide reductase heme-binding subunit